MAKRIEGVQGHVEVDSGKHGQDATVALVVRQNNVAHAPVTVHLTAEAADALIASLQAARALLPSAAPSEPTAPATPAAKKAG